jgi:hypothetical protein
MQIPSLPTDNLYKFLAISGLVIIILSVAYPLSKSKEFAMDQFDLNIKKSVQIIELERFAKELETFVEELKILNEE